MLHPPTRILCAEHPWSACGSPLPPLSSCPAGPHQAPLAIATITLNGLRQMRERKKLARAASMGLMDPPSEVTLEWSQVEASGLEGNLRGGASLQRICCWSP